MLNGYLNVDPDLSSVWSYALSRWRHMNWRGWVGLSTEKALDWGIDHPEEALGARLPLGAPVALYWCGAESTIWARQLIRQALAVGPVFILADESLWLERCLDDSKLEQAAENFDLQVWYTTNPMPRVVAKHGLRALWRELQQAGLQDTHTVFFIGDLEWLSKPVNEMHAKELQAWCARRNRCVILGHPEQGDIASLGSTYKGMRHVVQHVALMDRLDDQLMLYVDHWVSPLTVTARRHFGVEPPASPKQGLRFDGFSASYSADSLLAKHASARLIATPWVLGEGANAPAGWIVAEQTLDAIEHLLESTSAGGVVLGLPPHTDVGPLVRLIHGLRLKQPSTFKILVRESGLRDLRLYEEKLLLAAGANEVVYKDVTLNRLMHKWREGEIPAFNRDLTASADALMQTYLPGNISGYLAPNIFVELAKSVMERTRGLHVEHCLVRFTLLQHVRLLDALKAYQPSRLGDMVTADNEAVYVFLYACPQADLLSALDAIFRPRVDGLFGGQFVTNTPETIDGMLVHVQDAIDLGVSDYTLMLTDATDAQTMRMARTDSDQEQPSSGQESTSTADSGNTSGVHEAAWTPAAAFRLKRKTGVDGDAHESMKLRSSSNPIGFAARDDVVADAGAGASMRFIKRWLPKLRSSIQQHFKGEKTADGEQGKTS
jgi:cellulose biosynthesis protein BcsE